MSDISLIDTAYKHITDIWVVFSDLDTEYLPYEHSRFWGLLKPGFRHVECWSYDEYLNIWIRMDTNIELVIPQIYFDPPWKVIAHLNPTIKHVGRLVVRGSWRAKFFVGPITCVESVKSFIGVSAFFVRTPFQLYNFLRKEDG